MTIQSPPPSAGATKTGSQASRGFLSFSLGLMLTEILLISFGFLLPWWGFVIPSGLAGFLIAPRRRLPLWVGALGATNWVVVALIEDVGTAFRLSARLAGVAALPSGALLYPVLALLAGGLALLACAAGQRIRALLELGIPQNP